jgi:hypothetical protein
MPTRNYSNCTREEYESEPTEFIAFLTARNLTVWRSVRPYIAPHDGHALPSEGGDLKSVQEMLGHESTETCQIYLGLPEKV